jgi:ribosome assembly protein 1
MHLLDMHGHTDFAPEVGSALQCCGGALLVVKVVEGMCARTHQVVWEAHAQQCIPIMVINKMD